MNEAINIAVDWKWVAAIVLTLGLAYIGFLRDRMKVIYRIDELEAKLQHREDLLNEPFLSDFDKLLPVAVAIQEAARAQGKELRIKDIAIVLRQRRLQREKKKEQAGERT